MTLVSQIANRNQYMIALGANASSDFASNAALLRETIEKVNKCDLCVVASSSTYRTPAFPKNAGPDFANACLLAESPLNPAQVLEILHALEAEVGRVRTQRWGQRVLDLDLIGQGQTVAPDLATFRHWCDLPLDQQMQEAPDELILPHPRLQDRAFVLVPLAEIAPDWRHPVLGQTVLEMKNALPAAALAEIIKN